jgi:hypothetical protein
MRFVRSATPGGKTDRFVAAPTSPAQLSPKHRVPQNISAQNISGVTKITFTDPTHVVGHQRYVVGDVGSAGVVVDQVAVVQFKRGFWWMLCLAGVVVGGLIAAAVGRKQCDG